MPWPLSCHLGPRNSPFCHAGGGCRGSSVEWRLHVSKGQNTMVHEGPCLCQRLPRSLPVSGGIFVPVTAKREQIAWPHQPCRVLARVQQPRQLQGPSLGISRHGAASGRWKTLGRAYQDMGRQVDVESPGLGISRRGIASRRWEALGRPYQGVRLLSNVGRHYQGAGRLVDFKCH